MARTPEVQSLKSLAAQIQSNCRAFTAGVISYDEFGRRNGAAWDAVSRGEQNIIGSACSRRHLRMMKYLGVL